MKLWAITALPPVPLCKGGPAVPSETRRKRGRRPAASLFCAAWASCPAFAFLLLAVLPSSFLQELSVRT